MKGKVTLGGITHICFKQWFQITADAHPGVSGVSKYQKFCDKFKNTPGRPTSHTCVKSKTIKKCIKIP
jgi:hypothetical protein